MEAASILGVLGSGSAVAPGGRDRDGRPLVILRLPPGPEAEVGNPSAGEKSPTNISLFREDMDCALRYLTTTAFSEETRRCRGLTLLIDARRAGAWREVRGAIRLAEERLSTGSEEEIHTPTGEGRSSPDAHPSVGPQNNIIVIRPDSGAFFWSKQRGSTVHCARSGNSEAQPIYVTLSRLLKYVENSQLPEDLGGSWPFDLDLWIQNRIYTEAFVKDAVGSLFDLEKVCARLSVLEPGARVSSTEDAFCLARAACNTAIDASAKVLLAGKGVLQALDVNYVGSSWKNGHYKMPQDILDSKDKVEKLLEAVRSGEKKMKDAWATVEKQFGDAREANALEDGVKRVTDWILGPAELLLNSHSADVGSDIASSEELRLRHEALEMLCRETYGQYAELLHKIDCLPLNNIALPKDLKSQRDFMDFVCRSFASRLERRRNILITCLRFYRLVAEYFDRTSEVFETYVSHEDIEDFESADSALHDLQDNQTAIDAIEQEVLREGEKLTDLLCMPAKDALGRDLGLSREGAILEVRGVLRATAARARIFGENVELQKLRLEQISHIRAYEKDATQAMQWLDELFQVLLESHSHVGCNVTEIQSQKEQHQAFQETAKGTYEYGCQLVSASLSLRQSCELPTECNERLGGELWRSWDRLQAVGREQMTRLRVSAVFHRSVQEHCSQLIELMEKVKETRGNLASNGASGALCSLTKGRKGEMSTMANPISLNDTAAVNDTSSAGQSLQGSMRRLLARREKLLMEVGRMVRLGRLLRTRLREPLYPPADSTQGSEAVQEKSSSEEDTAWSHAALGGTEAPNSSSSSQANSEPYNNATAVEAISEKLSEVTALAEALDNSLCASTPSSSNSPHAANGKSRRRPFHTTDTSSYSYSSLLDTSGSSSSTASPGHTHHRSTLRSSHSVTSSGRRMATSDGLTSGTVPSAQDAYTRMKAEGAEEDDEEEEFVTASECTRSPSRSSSYHTASDGGGGGSGTGLNVAHWWQEDDVEDDDVPVVQDEETARTSELDTSDKQGDDNSLPQPPPPPPLPPTMGKIGMFGRRGSSKGRETTESTLTQLRVTQSHSLGITSYLLTSETIKDTGKGEGDITSNGFDHKNNIDVASETSLCTSSLDQSSTETLQNGTSIGVLSEEELTRQMEESRDWLQLKIVEAVPEPSRLGSSLAEAVSLQRAHDNVLTQLQSKQSPVEELLRQADQLISSQHPRAEVYAAMAESLGLAWKDVNTLLELRKTVLDLNVAYHSRAEECLERMNILESECHREDGEFSEEDSELVKAALTRLHDMRKGMLESLSAALQEGKALLGKTREIAVSGTLDSRPDKIRGNAEYAVSQVEHWLETLHDQRQALEGPWRDYRSILERRLALSLLASDLTSLENALYQARDINLLQREEHIYDLSLGDSSSSAELLLHEHKKMDSVAMDLRDRALKITKATEHLVSTGPAPGGQSSSERRATSRAYAVLGGCTDFGEHVEQRAALLMKAIAFFRSAQAAQTKLDQIEVQLCTMPKGYGLSNSQLASLHSQAAKALDDTVEAPIREGYEILKEIGNENAKGILGIKHAIEELEKRKIRLGDMCTAHKEENVRLSQALTLFLEKQNDLYSWLVSIAEAFLQGHQDMGSVYPMAQDFLELHKKLLNDLNLKGTEIEALLSTLPPILEWLEGEQRADVACKASALRLQWVDLRALLEARIDLCTPYVGFHSLASRLGKEIDSAEDGFKEKHIKAEGNGRNGDDVEAEQRWLSIQQLFLQLTNTGKNFLQDAEKATDPYLDIKRACLCVQTLLEHLGSRQLVVNEAWEEWQQRITIRREFQVQWERTMTESSKTIEWVSKLEAQFYPVIRGQSSSSRVIARELEERLQSFIPEVKRAQSEIELRVKTIETLTLKGDTQGQKDLVVKNLNELHQKFQLISTEYQILVQMLIAFFKNMSELDRRIENLQSQYRSSFLPRELPEAESQLKDHEASRQAVLELFKFTQTESEQIISRIHQQEPFEPGKQDAEKVMQLLEGKRAAWEAAWAERRAQLEQCLQRCQFDCDLRQINSQLSDLGRQLSAIRGQYGESLSTAQATSLAFVYFEKTIEILEQRIRTFVSTAEQAGSGTRHGNLDDLDDSYTESHIHRELTQLQARWSAFHSQVVESRRLINLSIEYFTLVEEAERWFKEGSKLLVTIARKSTTVRTPEEATQLLNEVEMFLKPGEIRQDERIKKISALAVELYGEEKSKQVKLVLLENREMLDSFTIINEELNSLAENLKAAEMQRILQKKEQEEVDASLSAARAEAAAASAAAAAAEEARKAAEAAAKALSEAAAKAIHDATIAQQSLIERVEVHRIETVTSAHDIINEVRKKTPSPVQKPKIEDVPVLIAPSFTLALHDCTVQEGDRLLLECKVIGDPLPEIVWYKDGISIQSNPDYHTTYNQGICSLSIEETFAEDSAKFTCKATNSAGTAETSAMLTVKEAELQDQLSPPLFTRNLFPSTAKEGSSYQLECCVSGNPLPTVQWFKGDVCIDSSPDYSITYNNGEAVLRFEEIFLDDQAEYRCRATNCVGTEETRARLSVEAIEPSEAPSFVLPLSNVMARAGLKLKLECEVTGLPTPKLTWTHNGKLIKETRDTRIISDGKKEILVISEAFPKDAGVYVVSAKNKCGEASSSCNVSVKGRLPTETSDSELASDMEPIKPSIQVPLRDMTSKEGEQVRLDCVIVGQPEPEVIWYHNERPVKESPDFKLLFQGDRCSLIIKEAYPEDSGEYKVVAINSAGEASSLCQLNIKTSEPIPPVVESPPIETLPVGIAPRFNKLLTDVLVAEGEEVVLECSVHGEPEPKIKWLLNNQEMTSNPNIKFDQDPSGTVSLTIKSASPEDRGVYTVKAINPSGEAKCFANLIVKPGLIPESYRRKTPILELVEKHTVPVFKEIFTDKNVPKGEAVKFECIVTGRPTPKVRWCFDDQPVSGQGFWVSTSGERQVLSIPEALPHLSGKISCIAENEEGRAVCSAILSVEAPIPIEISNEVSRIDLQKQEDEDDRLSSPSFSMKRAVFMQTSSQMQTIKSSSSSFTSTINTKSGEPTVSSQSQSITSQTEKAFKQVGDQPPLQIEAKKIEVMQQVNGNQPVVKQQSSLIISKGEDKQIQEDSFSSGTMEQSLVPLPSPPKPQRKSIAPRFISPLMGRIVDQGTDVTLEAIVDGYPEPTITWLKNGTEELDSSKPDSSVIITFDHGRACLELKAVNVKDAGRYTCKIVNNAGTATSTADLVVKKTVFPPVFGRRLQAQVAKKGQRVVMEVEVTGTPDPTITWSKDGTPIIYNTKPYRIKNQGCCHSVIIDEAVPAHSGRFTVRAVNAGGEAQSSADFVVVEEPPEGSTEQITTYVIQDMQETSRETKQKQPTEKVVVLPRPAVATEVERTVLQAPPMPKDVPKTEIIDTKPKDTLSSSVTEIVLETTQHTEKHVSMKMQHSPFPDFPEPEEKSFSTVGIQSDSYEVMTPDIPTESPKATEPDDDVKQDNDREKRDKELVEIKQQGSVQEALSKFKKLESQIESPMPQKVIQMDDFKQEQTSSETLIIKNLSLAPSVPKVGSLMTTGTNIPIEIEKPQSIKFEKPLDIVESVLYTPSSSVIPPEEPITIKTLILESGEEIEPGPPPEMGYIPKSEVPSKGQKEEVACKVKKLQEESQKVLSPVEIPSGAVRLFPVSTAAPLHTISSIGTSSSAFSHWIGKESEPVKTVTSIPVMTESLSKPEVPIFSKEPIKETEMTSFREHTDIQIKDEFKSELIIKPPIDKTEEFVIRPRSPIARSLTPGTLVPSAEGVAMEKIWASRKTPEPEVNVVSHSTPSPFQTFHRDNTNSPRPPSAQGVAMDRIWAHKHPERSIKMSWPPQPTAVEEDRTVPVWVSRGKSEPLKCPTSPPVSQQETHHHSSVTDVSVIKEYSSFESSLKQEQICTPVPPTPVQTIKPLPPPPTVQPTEPVPPAPPAEIFKSVPVSSPVQTSAPVPPSLPAEIFKPVQAPKHIPASPPAEIFKPIPPPPPLQTYKPAPPPPPVQTFKPAPPPPPMQTFKPAPPPEPTFKPASPIEQVIKPAPSSEKIFKPVPQVAKPTPPDSNVLHYVAHVTHLSTAAEQEDALRSVETTSTTKMEISSSHVEKTFEFSSVSGTTKSAEPNPMVVEEKGLKPSEAKKVWPPGPHSEFEPMAPPSIKTGIQPQCYVETSLPKPTFDEEISIQLEPGPPPEIGFMQPTLERRVSKVESIELDLDKEPSKHIVGAVRTIPPPLKDKFKAKKETVASPLAKKAPVSDKKPKMIERPMSTPPISLSAFKPFPELEPFPFKPDQSKKTHTKVPPPPKPSKFVKGEFTESDYESDIESTRIPAKWRPYGSDTEGLESHKPTFRRVKPPGSAPPARRPASVGQAPLPPSAFETEPPKLEGHQPEVLKGTYLNEKGLKVQKMAGSKIGKVTQDTKKVEKDEITEVTSVKVIKKQMTHTSKQSCVTEIPKRKRSPPSKMSSVSTESALDKDSEQVSEPKSPVKGKPSSPKMKGKKEMTESGYMADTDEPIWQQRMQSKETKSSTVATSSMSSTSMIASKFEQKVPDSPQESANKNSQKVHHHHQASSKFLQQQQIAAAAELIGEGVPTEGEQGVVKKQQKELIAPAIVKEIPLASKDIIYKKDKTQVVPSPSKFVKGEFRVSDYESDYDTRIPPIWRPHESDTDEPSYRSVRPILTCTRKAASVNWDIIPPIPPTKFEEFPQSDGQLSSQLKPIERVSTPIAKISKAISQSIDTTDTISHQIRSSSSVSAQPAFSPPVVLPEPGPPPEERYAPPPPQYARQFEDKKKTDKNPLQAVETSKKMHFTESSETCHRVVSMEHTTRVIQFGEKEMKGVVHPIRSQFQPTTETPRLVEIAEPALEPFPFKPEPQKPRQPSGPPPPKPKKFTKGEFRESDYESDVENVRIKPIWVPHDSDSEEPHYRKVRPPSTTPKKSDGSDRGGPSPAPPSEFEKPPELSGPQKVSIPSVDKSARTKVSTTVFKTEAEQKRLMRVEEMKRRFSGGTEMQRQFQPVTKPVDYPDGIILQPGEEPEYGYAGSLPASATQAASHHMSEMSHTFKSKAQQFVNDIMKTTSESSTEPKSNGVKLAPKVGSDEKHDDEPHSYREESRLSQFGTKCIDPDTGLIYFKYDFGYEFGVLLPGEGAGMRAKNAVSGVGTPSKPRDDDIAVPVIHEKSGTPDVKTTSEKSVSKLGGQNAPKGAPVVPQFRPKKFTHLKSVKWEPTSESELSDAEGTLPRGGGPRRLPQPAGGISEPRIIIPTSPSIPPPLSSSPSSWKWVGGGDGGTMSPLSLSPRSLPSFSPHPQQHSAGGSIVAPLRITPGPDSTASPSMTSPWTETGMSPTTCRMGGVQGQGATKVSQGRGNTPTPPSTPSTPSSAHGVYVLSPSQPIQPRKPPTFITPLKDIAVKSGGTARFECIVQAEPPPNILWSKNGRIIENNPDHEIHYRNGVCRLTIPEAYPEDAGTYTCTATNMLGTIGTTGSLQVPGEKRKPLKV